MDLNFEHLHLFFEGMKLSREAHAEESKSFEYGLNGRLYSYNGRLAYSSIKGTIEIYNDPNIIKYLGFYSFIDELVVFVKYNTNSTQTKTETSTVILGQNITIDIPYPDTIHSFTNELSVNAEEIYNTVVEDIPIVPDEILQDNYNAPQPATEIDLSQYYLLSGTNVPNYEVCQLSALQEFEYNGNYDDAIIVFTKNGYHAFNSRIAWLGKMNWDINRKITTVGIDENLFYKRVYFTDNLNPLRVFNLKDNELEFRSASEFDIVQEATMLQPQIKQIKDGGSIKAMTVQYAYRLITENGQVTKYSPYSELVYILRDSEGYDFEGGAINETTSKQVIIEIPIINTDYKDIQAIAIEYTANTIPSAIRNLGIKSVTSLVEFTHNGNESEFSSDDLTLDDITEVGNTWKYCNDITAKDNKLIAAGLRNEPYALAEKYVQDLFLFKGWDNNPATHDYLINPDPKTYKYIDPTNTENAIYLKKQLYHRFLFFGNVTLTLNSKAGASASITFTNSSDQYIDYIEEVWLWLSELDLTAFPNLQITRSNLSILFSSTDGLTDLFDYYFTTSISQAIIDFDNEYGFLTVTPNTSNLVYGAQSVGFNQGTGVRVTWKEIKEPVMHKGPELYTSGPILDIETPTLGKTFVKNEIYRLSVQFFKNGNPLFAIVLGDIATPKHTDGIREILEDGSLNIQTSPTYVNQSVSGDTLYAHRLEARVELRIPCIFKQQIDSYQIQYVQRTENNRTILCQGISAPLIRLIDWEHESQAGIAVAPNVYSKWTLPFNGGPLYAINDGFLVYDDPAKGEEYNTEDPITSLIDIVPSQILRAREREITNRKMFYFDSPDLIQEKISSSLVANGSVHVIGRVNTDATRDLLRSRYPGDEIHDRYYTFDVEIYQNASFSKKIGYSDLTGTENQKPYHVNVSVFSNFTPRDTVVPIERTSDLLTKGEIITSAVLGTSFEAVNMALAFFGQGAYNSGTWRSGDRVGEDFGQRERYSSQSADSSQESHGYPTVFIRAQNDVFTDDFIGPEVVNSGHTTWMGEKYVTNGVVECSDSHAIINILMDNADSIYGGRTKYAYSQNEFIPLGKVIPIRGSENSNQSQIFTIQGDFFTTLYLRTKNDYSVILDERGPLDLRQSTNSYRDAGSNSRACNDYNRGGAWAYAVILETEVESRMMDGYQFYKSEGAINFSIPLSEIINPAYFKSNDLRVYSPVPYNFKDNPLRPATLSASKTKLNGDYYDAWTQFLLNEFYDLEINKGIITNVTNWRDSIFAIQEQETSEVFIDESNFVTTDSGEVVALKKGDGRTFTNHKKISDFGTSIRRALAEGEFGFSFFDERYRSFVKFGENLSLGRELQTKLHELFEYDKVIDTEGYYDPKYKETNIRLRTESGCAYLLSYNELEKVFNGWYAYDHDIYITFDKRVFVPCCGISDILINCPVIFSGDSVSVQIYQYFEYQILATEDPINYRADNLPGTLNINTNTGLIYGVIETPGTYTITVWAENEECYDTLDIVVTANIDQLYGISIGIAVVTGFLSGKVNIEGVSNGSATVTGTLTYAHSQITATADGVATVTATIIGRVAIFGTIDAGATVNGEMQLFNFFFGGTESTIPDKYTLARMYDAGNAGGSSVAFWQGSAIKIWDRNHYHGADYPYIDEIQVWVTAKKFMFYVDTFFNNQKLTWAIDVGGNCDIINQGAFSRAGQLKWVYLPTARMIHGPSGYFTFGNNFSMRGYIDFRNVRGLGWNENLYGGYSSNQHMNHIFNNAYGITTLNFAKLEEITLQWSNRSNLQNITALKRFYAPLLRYCAAACSSYPYYNPTVDDRKTTRIGGGTTSGVGKIFYLSPEMATSRRSDAIITVDAAVPAGATVEINGLTYTAVIGAPANSTEFQTGFVTTFPHKNCITSLINAVHSDTRIGAYGGYQQRDIIQIVNTLLSDGPPAKGLIRAKIDGAGPDVITCSVSGAGLYVSAPTLMYGGTPDRTLVHWIDTGTEIRYVTSFENPNAVTDLSASNITKDSFVLNFTPPPITVNPLDFYEVWVYDGSTLEYLFVPYQEITGSGDMVIGLNPGRQYKVKIVTRDYFYNGSEFSNEIIVQMQLDEEINSIATVTGTMYRKNTATGNAMIDGIINGSSSHISVLEDRIDTEGFTELTGTLTAIGSLEGTTNGLTIIEAVL